MSGGWRRRESNPELGDGAMLVGPLLLATTGDLAAHTHQPRSEGTA
ncbi:MAG: hypothetical protein ACI9K2_003547, partial [Myxococcota bacterium]